MALILDTTGQNISNPPMLSVRKGFESLMITTSVKYSELANEQISISLQRKSGNIDLFKGGKIDIKKLIQLSASSQGAIAYNGDGNLCITVDLTPVGNIPLAQNEEIQIQLFGLGSTKKWILNTVEAPFDAVELYQFSKNIMAATTQKDDFDVTNCDVVLLQKSSDVTDVRFNYSDARYKQTVATLAELEGLAIQADPVQHISELGAVTSAFSDYIVFGLQGVTILEVNKGTSATYTLYTREIL